MKFLNDRHKQMTLLLFSPFLHKKQKESHRIIVDDIAGILEIKPTIC